MPSNPILTDPDAVMPQLGPMVSFSEELERPALLDGPYPEGESTRSVLTLNARRIFRFSRRLPPAAADELKTFLLNRKEKPFWFYNLRETQPVGAWDPTGQNPVGRYAVVWAEGWQESLDLGGRGNTISIVLREVDY